MTYTEREGEVEIADIGDFVPELIFECGQCFRWDADADGGYVGVAMGQVARVRRGQGGGQGGGQGSGQGSSQGGGQSGGQDAIFISGTADEFEATWRGYFDMDRDYGEIRRHLCIGDFMRRATGFGAGIRILRQDAWEALCSFIVSQCNNIPRIKKIISTLCRHFGDAVTFEDKEYHTFPSASRLASLDEADLAPLRCGYRAAFIIGAARDVDSGKIDLEALKNLTPADARSELKKLRGVGNKVADCTALFGLHMLDAFPLDVWMKRAIAECFPKGFDPAVFSPYAGIAQQYIFHHVRTLPHQ